MIGSVYYLFALTHGRQSTEGGEISQSSLSTAPVSLMTPLPLGFQVRDLAAVDGTSIVDENPSSNDASNEKAYSDEFEAAPSCRNTNRYAPRRWCGLPVARIYNRDASGQHLAQSTEP